MTSLSFFAKFDLEGVSASWAWLWIVLLLAGAALLYFTYLGIFQRSERRLTWVLLLLRATGLLLLVLALARPTWTRESEKVEPGHVAIILDNSRSMSLPDATGTRRYDRARAAVEKLTQALTARNRSARVVVDLFDVNGKRLDAVPPEPTVPETDLARALDEVPPQLRSRPLAGLVLISDGMNNSGDPDLGNLEATLPIHTLRFAEVESNGLDLEVRSPKGLPRDALIHNALRIEVPVVKTGKAATEATVVLARGKEVLATQKVKLRANNVEELVPLTFTPHEAGPFVFTVRVEGRVAERDLANNAVNFPLDVNAEPIHVLYLEGFLRYEHKYLKALLEEDPDVVLDSVVRLASPDTPEGRSTPEVITDGRLKEHKIDVVILGDMEGQLLSAEEYRTLLRWLDEKNHSLLVLGGYRSFGPDGFRKTPLASALPVEFVAAGPTQSEESFRLQLTDQGEGHPIFSVSNDRVKDAAAWSEALPLQGMSLVQRARPAAVTLAVNPKVRADGKPGVVLAVQRAGGGGQVMVLTADTTWRWSRLPRLVGQPDTLYSRFWSQTIRYLANRDSEKRAPLVISPDKPTYQEGEKVTIKVTRTNKEHAFAGARLTLDITGPDGKPLPPEKVPPLKNSSGDTDHFTADFVPEAGGRYEVAATLQSEGKSLGNQVAELRVLARDVELSDPGTNPALLESLANTTGGYYAYVENAEELASKLNPEERRSSRLVTTEYWRSPWLFGGFLLAVSGEWLLRRRNHLV